MSKTKTSTKPASLTDAFARLEKLVKEFESGEIKLEAGIKRYEEATKLAAYIKRKLDKLENKITRLKDV